MTALTDFENAIDTLHSAIDAALTNPADAIQLCCQLATYTTPILTGASAINQAIAAGETATITILQTYALRSLAKACAAYSPTSSDDARSVLGQVVPVLDAAIDAASVAGYADLYRAVRTLRTAVVNDLQTRGSQLPGLTTVSLPVPLPSLVVAYQLYQDATRSDEIITRNNPPHPGFMPTTLEVLSY